MNDTVIGIGAWIAVYGSIYVCIHNLITDFEKLLLLFISPALGGYIAFGVFTLPSHIVNVMAISYVVMFQIMPVIIMTCTVLLLSLLTLLYEMVRMTNTMSLAENAEAEQMVNTVLVETNIMDCEDGTDTDDGTNTEEYDTDDGTDTEDGMDGTGTEGDIDQKTAALPASPPTTPTITVEY